MKKKRWLQPSVCHHVRRNACHEIRPNMRDQHETCGHPQQHVGPFRGLWIAVGHAFNLERSVRTPPCHHHGHGPPYCSQIRPLMPAGLQPTCRCWAVIRASKPTLILRVEPPSFFPFSASPLPTYGSRPSVQPSKDGAEADAGHGSGALSVTRNVTRVPRRGRYRYV